MGGEQGTGNREQVCPDAIEALADAISVYEGYWKSGTRANRNRNPGNLRPILRSQPRDEGGYRIFHSLCEGYGALCGDLEIKFAGHSRSGLKPDSTLAELIAVWAPAADSNDPKRYAAFVAQWLTVALGRPITPETWLSQIKDLRQPDPRRARGQAPPKSVAAQSQEDAA